MTPPKTQENPLEADTEENPNLKQTSQAEGSKNPGETDVKVGRTPGQAEGTEDPDEQDEK